MIGIYKITNKKTGKSYIGQSNHIERRWKEHRMRAFQPSCSQYESHLYRSIREYGLENFSFEIVEECSEEKLNDREKYYIQHYNTYNNGYNLTEGGDSNGTAVLQRKEVNEIIELLKRSKLSHREIGEKYGVSTATISGINCGYNWHDDTIKYPIRDGSKYRFVNGKKYSSSRPKNTKSISTYYCSCGNSTTIKNGLCYPCAMKKRRVVERPSVDVIIKQVATLGFKATAQIYGVSDNTVKDWLKSAKKPYLLKEVKQLYGNYTPPKEKRVIEKYENLITIKKNEQVIGVVQGLQCAIDFVSDSKLTKANRLRISEGIRRVLSGKRDSYLGLIFIYHWDIA